MLQLEAKQTNAIEPYQRVNSNNQQKSLYFHEYTVSRCSLGNPPKKVHTVEEFYI